MLTKDEIERIEKRSEEMLERAHAEGNPSAADHMTALPVDLSAILKSLKLKKDKRLLRPGISGSYDKSAHEIRVNLLESKSRQAFTIAHEIGHAVLHADRPQDTFLRCEALDPAAGTLPPEEQQANWFAASLLMPRTNVQAAWGRVRSLQEMQNLFGVSAPAMEYRLKNLHLIN
jgi:Zn-dependent peptidase ImmA (M78 family)